MRVEKTHFSSAQSANEQIAQLTQKVTESDYELQREKEATRETDRRVQELTAELSKLQSTLAHR